MTAQQIAVLALFAVLTFWAIGAHTRLVALRRDIGDAWAKVDAALRQRRGAGEALLGALREPLAAEAGALGSWQATLVEAAQAAATMASRPVVAANAANWVRAEAAQAAAAGRVFALLEQQAEPGLPQMVATGLQAWREAGAQLAFARQLFNEAARAYDEAIATFPTRLLVRLFRFQAAGRL